MRHGPSDGNVPQGGDDADGPEEDEDVVPLEDEVQGPGPVLVEHAGRLRARGAVGECLWLTRVPGLVHVARGRGTVLLLKRRFSIAKATLQSPMSICSSVCPSGSKPPSL